jgi:hypothetical protein
MAEWWKWLGGCWTWLNDNGPGVTAVVTAVYAVFTVLLWRATKRQAVLTQRAFETTNRPYLSVRVIAELDPDPPGQTHVVRIQAQVVNTGTIPAEVTKWEVSGRLVNLNKQFEPVDVDDERTLRGDSVFPGDPYDVVFEFKHPGILGTPLPLRFLVTVEYRGVSIPEKTYRTVLEGERTPSSHRQRTRAT